MAILRLLPGLLGLALLLLLPACGKEAGTVEGSTRIERKAWSKGGPLRAELSQRFQDGEWQNHGPAQFFDQKGTVTHRGQYAAGLEQGAWLELDERGGRGEGSYEAGRREGLWRYYHPPRAGQGLLAERGSYRAGQRHGLWEAWDEAGNPLPAKTYE